MGLVASLSNALAGLSTTQDALTVVARNVSNAGTPGYHRQSLDVEDLYTGDSPHVRTTTVSRSFDKALQSNYNSQTAQSAYADVTATYLQRLQTYLGKPGDTGSLDTVFSNFQSELQAVSTSPDDYAARSSLITAAQDITSTLNGLSTDVQSMRQDTEGQLSTDVTSLNTALKSLENLNVKLAAVDNDSATKASLLDQRDRLVSQVAGLVDVRADYHSDGTVSLATTSGVGLLDEQRAVVNFDPAGQINATSDVGKLTLTTPGGLTIDLTKGNVIQGGEIGGLIDLRDKILPAAQSQLDEVAAGLSQAFSSNLRPGTAATGTGTAKGFSIDLADAGNGGQGAMRDGNDLVVDYTQNGISKTLKLVDVEDTSKLPLDYTTPTGERVVGVPLQGDAATVASALNAALGASTGISFSAVGTSPTTTLQMLDNGTGATRIDSLTAQTTSNATQGAGTGLSLFVDADNADFTNSLSGDPPQKQGYAARIALNADVVNNNALLVQTDPGGTLGDTSRIDTLIDQLNTMQFSAGQTQTTLPPPGALNGTVSDLISQTINYQGNSVSDALGQQDSQNVAMTTLQQRMDSSYGVNIDDEMSQLIQLQNAYSANARVMTVIQSLITALMQA